MFLGSGAREARFRCAHMDMVRTTEVGTKASFGVGVRGTARFSPQVLGPTHISHSCATASKFIDLTTCIQKSSRSAYM
jgi:hypothetical protein